MVGVVALHFTIAAHPPPAEWHPPQLLSFAKIGPAKVPARQRHPFRRRPVRGRRRGLRAAQQHAVGASSCPVPLRPSGSHGDGGVDGAPRLQRPRQRLQLRLLQSLEQPGELPPAHGQGRAAHIPGEEEYPGQEVSPAARAAEVEHGRPRRRGALRPAAASTASLLVSASTQAAWRGPTPRRDPEQPRPRPWRETRMGPSSHVPVLLPLFLACEA